MSNTLNNVVSNAFKQAAILRGQNTNKANEIKGDGIIMKPCAECHRLMRWSTNENTVYKCKHCMATYGHEFKVNHHMGLNDEGQAISQVGAPVADNHHKATKTEPAGLQIGHGKGAIRMKRAQQYATSREHIQKLLIIYGRLVTDTLHQLGVRNNVDGIKAAVVREFEEWYTRYPSRLWTKDTINHLAISTEASLKRGEGIGIGTGISVTQIASKMHEIYERDYKKEKKTMENTGNQTSRANSHNSKIEGVSRLDRAGKLHQRIIAGHQKMKQQSNIASVLALSNPQKDYIVKELKTNMNKNAEPVNDMTLGYISSTFEGTQTMAEDAMKRATTKTTYPILLAVAVRRHSLKFGKVVHIDDLKPTAKRHYRPILENSIRMHVRANKTSMNINLNATNSQENGSANVCSYVRMSKIFSKVLTMAQKPQSEEIIFSMLKDFDDLVFKHGASVAKATVLAYMAQNKNMLSALNKSPEDFNTKFLYKNSNMSPTKIRQGYPYQTALLALQVQPRDFLCTCDSWSRIADGHMIDMAISYMKALRFEYKRDLKNALQVAGFFVDLLAFSSVLRSNGVSNEQIQQVIRKLAPFDNPVRDKVVTFVSENEIRQ